MASFSAKITALSGDKCTVRVSVSGVSYDGDYGTDFRPNECRVMSSALTGSSSTPVGTLENRASSGTFIVNDVLLSTVSGKAIGYYWRMIERGGGTSHYVDVPGDNYTIEAASPTTMPSSISYPSSLVNPSSVRISWAASTGNNITYMLERSQNGNAYAVVYSGSLTSYSDYSISSAVTTIIYKVKAIGTFGTSDYQIGNALRITYNAAPTTPSSISVPSSIRGGQNISISWGLASDSNLSGYTLERAVNSGTFQQIYKGANRSYTDTAGNDWNTVQYQVKAYDTYNATSGYKTSNVINVVQNAPPVISGTDTNLGIKTAAFSQSYTVTDADAGQTITVVEKVDGVQKRSFTATSGTQYTLSITEAEWLETLNGAHTITITATDNYGSAVTRTYTFSKNETAIEIQLVTPLAADDRIVRAIMSIVRTLPEAAIFTVEACNNGNDVAPTWIDVTSAVLSGSKFFFANTVKTAANWGFNFRIKVQRNGATGDCYIQGVGGNFE